MMMMPVFQESDGIETAEAKMVLVCHQDHDGATGTCQRPGIGALRIAFEISTASLYVSQRPSMSRDQLTFLFWYFRTIR